MGMKLCKSKHTYMHTNIAWYVLYMSKMQVYSTYTIKNSIAVQL